MSIIPLFIIYHRFLVSHYFRSLLKDERGGRGYKPMMYEISSLILLEQMTQRSPTDSKVPYWFLLHKVDLYEFVRFKIKWELL